MNANEPHPEVIMETPEPPTHLGRVGKAEWRRIARTLVDMGLLTVLDLTALGAYCASYQLWVKAEKAIRKKGETYTSSTGLQKTSPWMRIARDAKADMRIFAAEFGLTPATRSRLNISNPTDDARRRAEEFLFGHHGSA